MTARVNGNLWSTNNTGTMTWTFEDMIVHASRDETLRAGEVFGSGTVGNGCGAERSVSFQRGDVIELTIDRLGTLRNEIE